MHSKQRRPAINTEDITILVIDDEPAILDSMTYFLEDLGFPVLAAENGQMGLDIFEHNPVQVVITDLRMPKVDGLEVLHHVSAASPDTPLIVVSGTGRVSGLDPGPEKRCNGTIF